MRDHFTVRSKGRATVGLSARLWSAAAAIDAQNALAFPLRCAGGSEADHEVSAVPGTESERRTFLQPVRRADGAGVLGVRPGRPRGGKILRLVRRHAARLAAL